MDTVEILKQMKAELLQRVDAIDYAIRILETASIPAAEPAKTKTKKKKPAAAPEPESALDISKIPLWGGNSGGGIRLDD